MNYISPYDNYLESGVWKCPDSPTKAHYWIVGATKMQCKYCHSEKGIEKTAFRFAMPRLTFGSKRAKTNPELQSK